MTTAQDQQSRAERKRRTTRHFRDMTPEVQASELARCFDYDSVTGMIRRKFGNGKYKAGHIAGTVNPRGYRMISFMSANVPAHQVAWAIHYGVMPSHDLDHKDGCRSKNAIVNLREVTNSQNQQNIAKARADSTSGLRGVFWHSRYNTWYSQIRVNGKRQHLGCFSDKHEAHAAYLAARAVHHIEVCR